MPKVQCGKLPVTLSGLLSLHSGFHDLIDGGNVPEQVSEWKRQKLRVRTALLTHPIASDRGPKITREALFPLHVDTLELLRDRIRSELNSLKARVGPTATILAELQTLLHRVEERLEQRKGVKKAA